MSTALAAPANRFEVIDLYRGFGAICIFISHGYPFAGALWLPQAYLALDVFFVMSGFVIANGFDGPIQRGMTLTRFFALRMIRFYPAYLLALLLTVPLLVLRQKSLGLPLDWGSLGISGVLGLFMLPSPVDPLGGEQFYPLNGVSWSLFFEMVVNLIYFIIFPKLSHRGLLLVIGLCAVALVATRLYTGTLDLGFERHNAIFALPKLSFAFFVGVYLRRHVYGRLKLQPGWGTAIVSMGVMLVFFAHSRFTGGHATLAGDLLGVFVVFPAIVLLSSGNARQKSVAVAGLWSGRFSYPTYLLQDACFLLFAAVFKIVFGFSAVLLAPWILLPLLTLAIAAGIATDRWVEPWGAQWMRRWLLPPKPKLPASLPGKPHVPL